VVYGRQDLWTQDIGSARVASHHPVLAVPLDDAPDTATPIKRVVRTATGFKAGSYVFSPLDTRVTNKKRPADPSPAVGPAPAQGDKADEAPAENAPVPSLPQPPVVPMSLPPVRGREGRVQVRARRVETPESRAVALGRREEVKAAMQRTWKAYRAHAWGKDVLQPLSLKGEDPWGGMAVTMVDSLDTLWVMGLKDEFAEARDWIRDHLSFRGVGRVSVFETTIRVLGGLLSAYDLSGDQVFLDKARDLGDRLMKAFDTPSGIPRQVPGRA
jgi:hypothetical protein